MPLRKTGHVVLPLHYGRAPEWLTKRMKALANEMVRLIVNDYGAAEFLRRLADPFWFQAFGCVLGFDWHSSGVTTVVTGVLKDTLSFDQHGVRVAGGKGRASRRTLAELQAIGHEQGWATQRIDELQYASHMAAKVDTAAIQAGYPIYHHAFIITERGDWSVVQQGLDVEDRTARRYHWLSEHVADFMVEPHDGIVGDRVREKVLNMTAKEAEENRRICVDLVKGRPSNLISSIQRIGSKEFPLDFWVAGAEVSRRYVAYAMPRDLNWGLFKQLYEVQPSNYEELLAFRGVGPATVRALALVGELIYGRPTSWRDPVKYSWAFGGKDGVPYPVNRQRMDSAINFLKQIAEGSEISRQERIAALQRLAGFAGERGGS